METELIISKFDEKFKRSEHGYASYGDGIRRLDALLCLYGPKHIPFNKRSCIEKRITPHFDKIKFHLRIDQLDLLSSKLLNNLKSRNPSQFIVTEKEKIVNGLLEGSVKHKFKPSFIVGRYSFDLFSDVFSWNTKDPKHLLKEFSLKDFIFKPSIEPTLKRRKGVIIEVDGDFHNQENKMSTDSAKFELASSFGLMVFRVNNQDLNHPTFRFLVNNLKNFDLTCSKARLALNSKIKLSHVAFMANDAELKALTGLTHNELMDFRKFMRTKIVPFKKGTKSLWDR